MARGTLSPDFDEQVVNVRGIDFKMRELSIGEYDDIVKKCTVVKTNAIGEDSEQIDNTLLLRLMVLACCVDPKLTAEKMSALPMRVVLKLNQTVNKMHYGDEPETKKTLTEEATEAADPGNV